MKLTKVHTPKAYYGVRRSVAKCINPSPSRTYVRILETCKNYSTRSQIYPGKKNTMPDQLYALENGGFLARYTKPEWANRNAWPKTWWKTTKKGLAVIAKAYASK